MEKAKAERILEELCQTIGGDWLLVGGTLVQLAFDGGRSTEDIDLVHIHHDSKSRETVQNELFKFTLRSFGMGPEFINLAVEFFLKGLTGWEAEIQPFRDGPAGKIFRPSLTLFCALKLLRASELDLTDIQVALAKEGVAALNLPRLKSWVPGDRLPLLERLLVNA